MPRRKQDCPKRMKWELENAENAAAGKAEKPEDGDGVNKEADMSGGSDEDMGSESESEEVDNNSRIPEGSRESSPQSTGSSPPPPRPHHPPRKSKNGAASSSILDFSRGQGSASSSMISPLSSKKGNSSTSAPMGAPDSPLDLSKKPDGAGDLMKEDDEPDSPPLVRKLPKWSPPMNPKNSSSWNGHHNNSPDIKALEKMSIGMGVPPHPPPGGSHGEPAISPGAKLGRTNSSWQAQWLAQNSGGNREVFKCVVCRATFNTLAALSVHMKESKHGPPMPGNLNMNIPGMTATSPKGGGGIPPPRSPNTNSTPTNPTSNSSSSSNSDSLLLKETVQLPRKLVRGQDVWLGKGAEQTRQILKCMWCGQSFRSLAEMTQHMQQTQHYTNIISQEQLISWRSSEDSKGGSTSANSHVSAVLTCKVCDQAFSSLKELSNHMVKNSHYKEHIMRSITESGSRRRQSREKRKKSLPVRKLLELERANQEMKKEIRISCEKCSEKIPGPLFVEHLRICGNSQNHHHHRNQSGGGGSTTSGGSGGSSPLKQPTPSPRDDGGELDLSTGGKGGGGGGDKDKDESSAINAIEKMIEKSFDYRNSTTSRSQSGASLGPSPPIGTSILKRLGIDESVDYTKPLLDPALIPLGKYGSSPSSSSRARSHSVSSDKSEDLHSSSHRSHKSSNSHSNSSSPAPGEVSIKSPLKSPMDDATPCSDQDDNQSENHHSSAINLNNNNSSKGKGRSGGGGGGNSLSALSSMFESIGGGENHHRSSPSSGGGGNPKHNSSSSSSGGFNSHHPLAALQKLCDTKTENNTCSTTASNNSGMGSRPTSTSSSNPQSSPEPTLLGLNWANNAAEASDGNVFKCTFCDTPFLSKGAYRLHLAKMHFVKESKSPQEVKEVAERDPPPSSNQTINSADSPASKLIKYAELAKQLSSK